MLKQKFTTEFLEDVIEFLDGLDEKTRDKILYNVSKASFVNDSDLFKKLSGNIWEFRTLFNKSYYRLFAFWDKSNKSVVVATHGIVKKSDKISKHDLERAEQLRRVYFELKNHKK